MIGPSSFSMQLLREVQVLLKTAGTFVEEESGLATALAADLVVAIVQLRVRSVWPIKRGKIMGYWAARSRLIT